MQFIYIKTKEYINNLIPIIFEVLSDSLKIDNYFYDEFTLSIFYSYSNAELKNIITSLSLDLYVDILVYESIKYQDKDKLEQNYQLFLNVIKKYKLKYHYYNNKILLEENYLNIDTHLKRLILDNYYLDQEMIRTIIGFLENDQNISKASKYLYLHRNSLSQRLNKFEETTTFDLKKFKDGFLIYHLIK